jgi:hypothetical protein
MSLDVYIKDKYFLTKDKVNFTEHYEDVYNSNITHNLNIMATMVSKDFYNALWRPYLIVNPNREVLEDYRLEYEFEDSVDVYCKDIIEVIENGLTKLKRNPTKYKKYDNPEGWGLYEHFVPWVEKYLTKLKEYPNYFVIVCR